MDGADRPWCSPHERLRMTAMALEQLASDATYRAEAMQTIEALVTAAVVAELDAQFLRSIRVQP